MNKKENIELKDKINSALETTSIKNKIGEIIEYPQLTKFKFDIKYMEDFNKYKKIEGDLRIFLRVPNINVSVDENGVFIEIPKNNAKGIKKPKNNFDVLDLKANIGIDTFNNDIIIDLKKNPHTLIGGATGSGKTTMIKNIIKDLHKQFKKEVEIYVMDRKIVSFVEEFKNETIGTLDTTIEDIVGCLETCVSIIDSKFKELAELGKVSIYDLTMEEIKKHTLGPIIVIIDELADVINDEIYGYAATRAIVDIAQRGRSAGVHLILSTQRPDAKLISPQIKANMGNNIALKVATASNSRVILESNGAEKLNGKGDFLIRVGTELKRGQGYE